MPNLTERLSELLIEPTIRDRAAAYLGWLDDPELLKQPHSPGVTHRNGISARTIFEMAGDITAYAFQNRNISPTQMRPWVPVLDSKIALKEEFKLFTLARIFCRAQKRQQHPLTVLFGYLQVAKNAQKINSMNEIIFDETDGTICLLDGLKSRNEDLAAYWPKNASLVGVAMRGITATNVKLLKQKICGIGNVIS